MGATVFFNSANELATLTNTFKVNGVATDPGVATLTVTSPSNVVTSYTGGQLTHSVGTGLYARDVVCNEAGTWTYQWDGTTTASDTTAGTWDVQETALGRLYATVEALKSRLRITGTSDDYELHTACFTASRTIEKECGRFFWRTATGEVRTFTARDFWCVSMPEFCDIVSITSLKTDSSGDGIFESTWAAGDYQLYPVNPQAAPETEPYTEIRAIGTQLFPIAYTYSRRDRVQVTGVFGWPAVPRVIQEAAKILAQDVFSLKGATFGVQQFGDITVRVGTAGRIDKMIAGYRRNSRVVA